ncbi:carboxylating nicotinate-nucleotide diphosphorylase [Membranihabitans marinus]|uniref:carboxylating nicotinate-nucleotide diphosphorylase n=1 Tax=Membranihabitans marinus TaxID=1227546 RepID=UPI001F032ACC|nr:carboxylating nicotinate-nucleotide diphosphorylase [Membranihabitans marinus]
MNESMKRQLSEFVTAGLREDVGDGDHTSLACIDPQQQSRAKLLVKEDTVLAGMEVAEYMIHFVDPAADIEVRMKDGDQAVVGDVAFYVTMNSQALLKIERLLLNTMQRMCGVASMSKVYADLVKDYPVKVLDTRKTTPLMRFLEKWAVSIGGCYNYRIGLFDRIMIKDNHITASGSLSRAVKNVHQYLSAKEMKLPITLEVGSSAELDEALDVGGFDRIMLDNFTPPQMAKAVEQINGRFEVEASGGITESILKEVAQTGVDYISSGALTHSVVAKDLSLKIL